MPTQHPVGILLACILTAILLPLFLFAVLFAAPRIERRERRRAAWDALRWRDTQARWKTIRATGPDSLPGATGDGRVLLRETPAYALRGLYAVCTALPIAPWFLFVSPALTVALATAVLFAPLLIPARILCMEAGGFTLRTWSRPVWHSWSEIARIEPRRKYPDDGDRINQAGLLIVLKPANPFSREHTIFLPDHFPIGRDDLAGIMAALARSFVTPPAAEPAAPDAAHRIVARPRRVVRKATRYARRSE